VAALRAEPGQTLAIWRYRMATVMAGRCGPNWRATSARPDLSRDGVWSTAGKKGHVALQHRNHVACPGGASAVGAADSAHDMHRVHVDRAPARCRGETAEDDDRTVDLLWGFILAGSSPTRTSDNQIRLLDACQAPVPSSHRIAKFQIAWRWRPA
jgi:hypothetical protein